MGFFRNTRTFEDRYGDKHSETTLRVGRIVAIGLVAALLVGMLVTSIRIIPGGMMGVIVTSPTGPSYDELPEGWSIVPFWNAVEVWPYRNQEIEMSGETEETALSNRQIQAVSKDNLRIFVDASLIFQIPTNKVADVRILYGDAIATIIIPLMRSIPRDVISNFNAFELRGEQRETIALAITVALEGELAKHNIIVVLFAMRGIRLDESVEDAIAAKKIAEQNVITASLEKQRLIILAEAERNATILIAEGQAEAIRILTEAFDAMDNRTLAAYLTFLFFQALQNPDSNVQYVIIIPEGGGAPQLILNPPTE